MRKVFLVFLVFLISIQFSCLEDDGTNFYFEPLSIVSADVPESFTFGETYEISVEFLLPNGCTSFEGFDIYDTAETERNIVALGSVIDDPDVACTQALTFGTSSFLFEVIYQDDYLFRFWTGTNSEGEDEYLEIEIPVD